MADRWTRSIQCYTPWLNAMNAVLDDLIRMDDYQVPSNPENFRVGLLTANDFTSSGMDPSITTLIAMRSSSIIKARVKIRK